ncbi:CHASE2 domain-containing protein [Nodosilinea sp. PGN35]|uniref:CHASE2 domain-containing protein n=1 Tax=Nodosilinea sp. PGN35 TaxID=3020489 RepID=UPI0023B29F69|nr:CHASE2 domain-containing protein [Nodosilinea sp. TSF1-S3]MDF0365111.1 CHASE2 domain-containing protein [Nodosilinea sp. TSF1-S3]
MLAIGTLLNQRYRILRPLKENGLSLIYEVVDTRQFNTQNVFGLLPSRAIKVLKVCNVFGSSRPDAEEFFRNEVALLKRLNHPQIVRYLDDFDYRGDRGSLPCVVLEKVPGTTLENYLDQQTSIPEEQILDWLGQCADILDFLHSQQRVMHLDIKPSNLMVRPTGEVVFIDFGIARPISQTLLTKLVDSGEPLHRRAGTTWYMAPEQRQGKPIGQSDIYALGRTMVQALAHCPPEQVAEDDEGGWRWADIAPHISPELKRLLEEMTDYSIGYRLADAPTLKQRVNDIVETYFADRRSPLVRHVASAATLTLFSLAIAGLVMGAKSLGFLQPLELYVYDQLVRLRPDTEGPDPRMLIIEVTLDDVQRQQELKIRDYSSLSNTALRQLLDIIQPYEPAVVGIDIYREEALPANAGNNVITGCSITSDFRASPPPETSVDQVGFFDMPLDPGDRVRRQLIAGAGADYCNPTYAFSYQVTKAYLTARNIPISENEQLQINNKPVQRLRKHQALYADIDDSGYQTLLNYRTHREAATVVRLYDILDGKIDANQLRAMVTGKIVLIGTTDGNSTDKHSTPYGRQAGIILQAHQVSSLVSVALDGRKEIYFLPRRTEFGWIFLFSLLSMIGLKRGAILEKIVSGSLVLMALSFVLAYAAFTAQTIFLPLIPTMASLVLLLTFGSKFILKSSTTNSRYWKQKKILPWRGMPKLLMSIVTNVGKATALLQPNQPTK